MKFNIRKLLLCVLVSLALCMSHIRGSTMLVLLCLVGFMGLVAYSCVMDFTFPVLLFFLPWGPILRTNPESFSFYTFALIMVCAISVLKKRFRFKQYHVVLGLLLLFMTLFSKLLDGSNLAFDYIAFMMLLLVFPVVKEEWLACKYDFGQMVCYFSVGVIVAALCAMNFAEYPNIMKFINVQSYLTIIRRCGFYGDPNFYTAQVTAALGGTLIGVLQQKKRLQSIFMFILSVFLVYCGMLSGSKSFVLITLAMMLLWLVALFRLRGRIGFKLIITLAVVLVALFVASSVLFQDLLEVMKTRFSFRSNISDFTTGRTDLWEVYLEELLSDWKTLFLGKGYTNIKIGGKATHNTLLQMVFQLGLLGSVLLITWIVFFFVDVPKQDGEKPGMFTVALLLLGALAPWLAIDALFFDEFFLLQMYVYLGCRRLRPVGDPAQDAITDDPPLTDTGVEDEYERTQ